MAAEAKRSVFLVDDHPLVRESLKTLVDQQFDLQISGEAEDAKTALKDIQTLRPSIVVMDISLKESSGLDLLKALRTKAPDAQVLVLSMHDEKLYAERAIRAGAKGYVMKAESPTRIIGAIRQVLQGRLWLSEAMSQSLGRKQARKPLSESPLEELSDRELQVFDLLGEGLETRRVADRLGVSIKTVQAYCARIKQKLDLSTAAELVREAVRWRKDAS